MPHGHRRVAFSGKKKKAQLMEKRLLKSGQQNTQNRNKSNESKEETEEEGVEHCRQRMAKKLMLQPTSGGSRGAAGSTGRTGRTGRQRDPNRFNLYFQQESKQDLERMKLDGLKPYTKADPIQREVDFRFFDGYDFPIRPHWHYTMNKEALERQENKYFREYVEALLQRKESGEQELSLFELNIETWRQLWRVLEFSDILLIIVDVRFATLMFPPSLYQHIVDKLGKKVILILNKVDLVVPEVVVAWRHYFLEKYPQLPIVLFASNPPNRPKGAGSRRPRKSGLNYKRSIESVHRIFKECQRIVQSKVDLTNWERKIKEDLLYDPDAEDSSSCSEDEVEDEEENEEAGKQSQDQAGGLYEKGILTLGTLGFPNVGKSSLINALKGRKVVSVSRTPGHTKHFQTIFLTKTVRLCDCPGLVFPSSTPKPLQVLLGSFPISQLRVPYPSIQLIGEHLDLPEILKLQLPEYYDDWSAMAIAEAWAIKRGFTIARTSRPDVYRAANHLLRCCLAGHMSLILQFYPPDFHRRREEWIEHPDIKLVPDYEKFLEEDNLSSDSDDKQDVVEESSSDEEEEEDDDEDEDDDEEAGSDNNVAEEKEEVSKNNNRKKKKTAKSFPPPVVAKNPFALLLEDD